MVIYNVRSAQWLVCNVYFIYVFYPCTVFYFCVVLSFVFVIATGMKSIFWTGSNARATEPTQHLAKAKHKCALQLLLTKTKTIEETMTMTTDTNYTDDEKFGQIQPTMVALYFIILYNISIWLLKPFNKLLTYLGFKNTGESYVARENGYEMVNSIYNITKQDRKQLISKSNWINVIFDE